MMTLGEFKRISRAKGFRYRIHTVDNALKQFHLEANKEDPNYTRLSNALTMIILECDRYMQVRPRSDRTDGVRTLKQQAQNELRVIQNISLANAHHISALERYRYLSQAHQAFVDMRYLAHQPKHIELPGIINKLEHWINQTALGQFTVQESKTTVQQDLHALRNYPNEHPDVPPELRNVIMECINPVNTNQCILKVDRGSGANYMRAEDRARGLLEEREAKKYELKLKPYQTLGAAVRISSLLHELTHISIAETFSNLPVLLAVPRWYSHDQSKNEALTRQSWIQKFRQSLESEKALFTENQYLALKEKCEYVRDARQMRRYIDAYTNEMPRDDIDRLNNLWEAGVECLLVEYDPVINQMLLLLHAWQIPSRSKVYELLLSMVGLAYRFREKHRIRRPANTGVSRARAGTL